jgi:hypothetical protein
VKEILLRKKLGLQINAQAIMRIYCSYMYSLFAYSAHNTWLYGTHKDELGIDQALGRERNWVHTKFFSFEWYQGRLHKLSTI